MSRPFVIKLGGEVIQSPQLAVIAGDVKALGAVAIVHGGGAMATTLQKALGQEPRIVGGRRITDAATLDVMKMVVAGKMNVDLCAALLASGARPIGLHGASSAVVHAVKRPPKVIAGAGPDPVDLGLVGDVDRVDAELLTMLIGAGFVPVLACLGANEQGEVFNINADTVACHVATALDAAGLALISDVPGVLRDIRDPASRIATLRRHEADGLIADGTVTRGMVPKLEEAFAAIERGVAAVYILGKLAPGDLHRALTEPGSVGTVILP